MLPSAQFTRRADADGVDARTVERDYVLAHVMAGVATEQGCEQLVFKGGTALRLCYIDDYRYSADLDFSLKQGVSVAQGAQVVSDACERVAAANGFPLLQVVDTSAGPRIEYEGPLGSKRRKLKLDLADDELILDPQDQALLPRYSDLAKVSVQVYSEHEIAAEKLRCVMQRVQARDLFDIYQLLVVRDGLDLDEVWADFERKAAHKELDPGRFSAQFEKRMPKWAEQWETEMEDHVPTERRPDFREVERRVRSLLRAKLN